MQQNTEDSTPKPISINLLRLFVHVSIMTCAALLLLTQPMMLGFVRDGVLSPQWLFLGPGIFCALFVVLLYERFKAHSPTFSSLAELLPVFFGLAVIATLFSSSLYEYKARSVDDSIGLGFITTFSKHQDARVRALALLALARHNFHDQQALSLIHQGLLDKDPLVQQAAKLVIEDNLGIRFKNGSEGTGQAQQLMQETAPSALLMRKGTP